MFHRVVRVMYPPPRGKLGSPVETKYYDVLCVRANSSEQEIRKAYREMSRTMHPDKGGDAVKYQEITNAYSILSDPIKRACYDAYGCEFEKIPNLSAFIRDIQPEDVEIRVSLSIKDCIRGKQMEEVVTVRHYKTTKKQAVSILIPPHAPNGHRIVFHGQGHTDADKRLPGDIVAIVHEIPDPRSMVKRIGKMVLVQKQITLEESLAGLPIQVTLPDDSSVFFRHDIVEPNMWYKLDAFYVKFNIVYPKTLPQSVIDGFRALIKRPTSDKSSSIQPVHNMEQLVAEEQHEYGANNNHPVQCAQQ